MLIAFRTANFRAIHEEQELLITRAGAGQRSRLSIAEPVPGATSPVAAIYGANAAGKTTVLEALYLMRRMVRDSARWEAGADLPVEPFALAAEAAVQPFFAEVQFQLGASTYRYGFEALPTRFAQEWLYETPLDQTRRTERRLFERETTPDGRTSVRVSPQLRGRKQAIIDATRPNALFLSRAAQENFAALAGVYDWFRTGMGAGISGPTNQHDRIAHTQHLIGDSPAVREVVEALLWSADLGVCGIEEDEVVDLSVPEHVVRAFSDVSELVTRERVTRLSRPRLLHRVGDAAPVALEWHQESSGTREMFALAGPVIQALAEGTLLAIDEIESSLHPLMVRSIVELFQSSATNSHGAQLVFTTHDTTLLGDLGGLGHVLDRDQIWFVEKDVTGQIELTPLSDYHPRGDQNVERAYLQGRYGAVPISPAGLAVPTA